MSEFKGTPGPWSFDGSSAIVAEDTTVIIGEYWVKVIPESDDPDWLLMAAAPELLEALQSLVINYDEFRFRTHRHHHPQNPMILKARAAIAKALGETK